MKIALWIIQSLLALAFIAAGAMKLMTPIDELAVNMTWVTHFPEWAVRAIALADLLGGLGLILPSATRIAPYLTPLAAALLAVLMLGAFGTHVALAEAAHGVPSLVLASLAAFVAWGRFKAVPVLARANATGSK